MLLDSNERSIQRLACQQLGRFENYEALPAIVELLESGDNKVRSTALEALRQISGLDLEEPEAEVWRSALFDADGA